MATSRQAPKAWQQQSSHEGRLRASGRPNWRMLYGGWMPPGWACPKCRCRLLRVRFGPPGRTDKVYFECDQNPKRCRWRSERPMPYDEYMNRERAAEAAGLDRIPLDDWP